MMRYYPCSSAVWWPKEWCPSDDPACIGCHWRPSSPQEPALEIGVGGKVRMGREWLRLLRRTFRMVNGNDVTPLSYRHVDVILKHWVTIRYEGASSASDASWVGRPAPGWLEWSAGVAYYVAQCPSDSRLLRDLARSAIRHRCEDFGQRPAVEVSAILSVEVGQLRNWLATIRDGATAAELVAMRETLEIMKRLEAGLRQREAWELGMKHLARVFAVCAENDPTFTKVAEL